jgi:hypothetical protein
MYQPDFTQAMTPFGGRWQLSNAGWVCLNRVRRVPASESFVSGEERGAATICDDILTEGSPLLIW